MSRKERSPDIYMKNQPLHPERTTFLMEQAVAGLAEIDQHGSIICLNSKGKALLEPVISAVNFDDNNFIPVLTVLAPVIAAKIQSGLFQTIFTSIDETHHFTVSNNGTDAEKQFQTTVTRLSTDSILISFADVTEKRENENLVAQLSLDKAVEQDKFNFSANVLHDIGNAVVGFGSHVNRIKRSAEENNPENLQSLAGFFEAQQAVIAESIGEAKAGAVLTMLKTIAAAQKTAHDEIRRSVTDQLNIMTHIQEILTVQRQYVSGNETQENIPTHLRGIINDCMSMLFASIEKRNILLTLNVPVDLPVIMCNRTRLMQVLMNILKNSIEAICPDAEKKAISLNVFAHDGMVVLQVHDSGYGFDETTREKLFGRGFTTKSSGTGLGLNSCRAIIESFGGDIDITSDGPGKGALTTIHFNT